MKMDKIAAAPRMTMMLPEIRFIQNRCRGREFASQEADAEGQDKPPERGTAQHADQHEQSVGIGDSFTVYAQGGEQCDEDQYVGRIGQRNEEDRQIVAPEVVPFSSPVFPDLTDRIFQQDRHTDDDDENSAQHFDDRHVALDEGEDEGQ